MPGSSVPLRVKSVAQASARGPQPDQLRGRCPPPPQPAAAPRQRPRPRTFRSGRVAIRGVQRPLRRSPSGCGSPVLTARAQVCQWQGGSPGGRGPLFRARQMQAPGANCAVLATDDPRLRWRYPRRRPLPPDGAGASAALPLRTSCDSPSAASADCSIRAGAVTSPLLAGLLLQA